ncbi:NADH dehydrogenase I subunit H [Candidatus Kinetoplastibacterium desouzaii TCC079E]|uniref:NADH-quinone oxidoreductase subunit H n=1 Tax=Candidatus Kinetoplastidibacterium desouzai TCC079E TaxID=1208919 RepID=M1M494_9PROT|nr:NADH-quinone oxidoreductase subunit NuoH [Candidatus Kinetoplastibacterium desouzaii]AGF47045.1 NADH dehydrogenase I subunit H [Candidatus Kinetoplastibacterium desouzaii TCC079E]
MNNYLANLMGANLVMIFYTFLKILIIVFPVILCVAYLTYWERKMIAALHVRLGPSRVGYNGLLQPFADVIKLLTKEIVLPSESNKILFLIAPVITLMPALAAWAVIPFGPEMVLADINAGLLYFMSITSVGVYGTIIAGWASNSKYALLGALRASAQMISYELAIGFILVTIVLVSKSLNIGDIINIQNNGFFANKGIAFLSWNWLPLLPLFIIYIISAVAETNRHPFDVVEGESEIVAGHMVEYSGVAFAAFFLAEYANMILLSCMASVIFLGGWISPLGFAPFNLVPGWIWLGIKTFFIVSLFIWFRASFPRYRYDQIMRLGWKIFIPITGFWLLLVAFWVKSPWNIWY